MKKLLYFFKHNYKHVGFGGSLTFLSSFGQTFLISLYVPEIINTFEIKENVFGSLYAIATIISSALLLTIGHSIDHKSVKKVTTGTLIGLAISLLLLGFSHYHLSLLVLSLIGLRLCGQGMLSHVSQTVMAKLFQKDRGKALSISSLGFSLGEAIFPICISSFILWWGYETAAHISAVFIIGCLFILYFVPLKQFDHFTNTREEDHTTKQLLKDYKDILLDKKFLILMPASFALSFTSTSVFFYQYVFVENKGWSVSLYAAFFTVYAITRFLMSIIGGVWVDKYSARKIFRVYLIPLAIGLLPFAFMNSIIGALIFLIMTGITTGMAGTIKSATLAELYGVEKLGAIRSLFTMFMVISTALGPFLVGILIHLGVSFTNIMLSLMLFVTLAILNAQRIKNVLNKPDCDSVNKM